ncbi:YitT family protein [Actinotalea sp.]|uniref:membrane protein YczE n=1 Tax=Actinotalea sp. TaxID=1872145 RepID=UPI003563AA87
MRDRSSTRPGAGDHHARRAAQLLAGLVLYALSMAMLLHAALGSMPWDVLSQGVARHVPLSIGGVTLVTGLLVLLCWIPLRQRPGVGTVANVVVISALVDPFLALLDRLPADLPLLARVGLAIGGVLLNAVATASYIGARLGPGPRDGLMTGLVRRTGRSVRLVRSAIEVTVVLSGWALGGTAGLATVLYALAIGPLVHVLLPVLSVPVPPAPDELPAVDASSAGAVRSADEGVRTGTRPGRPAASAAAAGASGTRG